MGSPSRVLRSWLWNCVAAAVLFGSAAVCAVIFANLDGPTGGAVLVLAAAVVLVLGALRVLVVGVVVTDGGLIVRELFYTKRLPWAHLQYADVQLSKGTKVSLAGPRIAFVHNPTIYYRMSREEPQRSVTVTSLGAHRRGIAEQRADEINELIRHHRQTLGPLHTPRRRPTNRGRRSS